MNASTRESPDQRLTQARRLRAAGRTAEAERSLRQSLLAGEQAVELKLELARSLLDLGKPHDARLLLETLRDLPARGRVLLAWSLLASGKPDRAIRNLERSIGYHREEHDGLLLALARIQAGRLDAALEAVELTPAAGSLHAAVRAALLVLAGRAGDAQPLTAELPEGPLKQVLLGLAAERRGDKEEASKLYRSQLHCRSADLHRRLAALELERGNQGAAWAHHLAAGGRPADPGLTALAAGDRARAAEHFLAELQQHPDRPQAAHHLALLHFWQAEHELQRGKPARSRPAWLSAIGYLVRCLRDRAYLADWCARRAEVYRSKAAGVGSAALGPGLAERLSQRAAAQASQHRPAAGSEPLPYPLDLLLAREQRAAELVEQAGGVPFPGCTVSAGPLYFLSTGATDRLRPFLKAFLPPREDDPRALLEALRAFSASGGKALLSREEGAEMCGLFSTLGGPLTLERRGQHRAALDALDCLCCARCGQFGQPSCPQFRQERELPQTCCPRCPSFAECHPAYAASNDPGQTLRSAALALGLEAGKQALQELWLAPEESPAPAAPLLSRLQLLARANGSAPELQAHIEGLAASCAQAHAREKNTAHVRRVLQEAYDHFPSDNLASDYALALNNWAVGQLNAHSEEDGRDWSDELQAMRLAVKLRPGMTYLPNLAATLLHQLGQVFARERSDEARALAAELDALSGEGLELEPESEALLHYRAQAQSALRMFGELPGAAPWS